MFDLTAEEARLLLSVALMATGSNRFVSAARILAVLDRFRPNQASVASAKAVALMSAQRFDEAAEYIDKEALVRFPGNPMLLAFKGLALIRLGDREGSRMPLEEAASQKEDAAARQLAVDMLGDL